MTCKYDGPPKITKAQLLKDLKELVAVAGFDPAKVVMVFWGPLDREHESNCRRYAQMIPSSYRFEFARAILSLPPRHRLGLLAHEVGHLIAIRNHGDDSEDGADLWARKGLGITIGYDMSWPGKGLQYARKVSPVVRSRR